MSARGRLLVLTEFPNPYAHQQGEIGHAPGRNRSRSIVSRTLSRLVRTALVFALRSPSSRPQLQLFRRRSALSSSDDFCWCQQHDFAAAVRFDQFRTSGDGNVLRATFCTSERREGIVNSLLIVGVGIGGGVQGWPPDSTMMGSGPELSSRTH